MDQIKKAPVGIIAVSWFFGVVGLLGLVGLILVLSHVAIPNALVNILGFGVSKQILTSGEQLSLTTTFLSFLIVAFRLSVAFLLYKGDSSIYRLVLFLSYLGVLNGVLALFSREVFQDISSLMITVFSLAINLAIVIYFRKPEIKEFFKIDLSTNK